MGLEININRADQTAVVSFICDIDLANVLRTEVVPSFGVNLAGKYKHVANRQEVVQEIVQREPSKEQPNPLYGLKVVQGETTERRVMTDQAVMDHAVHEAQRRMSAAVEAHSVTDEEAEKRRQALEDELAKHATSKPKVVMQ